MKQSARQVGRNRNKSAHAAQSPKQPHARAGGACPSSHAGQGGVIYKIHNERNGAEFCQVEMPSELHDAVEKMAVARGIPLAELIGGAVRDYLPRVQSPAGAVPASAAAGHRAASVPMRSESVAAYVLRGKQRSERGGDDLEIQTFGLVPTSCFTQAELLDYVCQVFDEHRHYLACVVARELDEEDRAALLEALEYAQHWRYRMAEHGSAPNPLRLEYLLGLSGRRWLSHRELFSCLCGICISGPTRAALVRHFLGDAAPASSHIEWGEVQAVAEAAQQGACMLGDIKSDERLKVKADALMHDAVRLSEAEQAFAKGEGRAA
jgi:hypothetical protein